MFTTGSNMKPILSGAAGVFVSMSLYDFITHKYILTELYEKVPHVWRPEMDSKLWIFAIVYLVSAYFFTHMFHRGFMSFGVEEGVRFGLMVGMWISTITAYGSYIIFPISYEIAVHWWLYSVLGFVLHGIVVALVFKIFYRRSILKK